MTLAFWNAAKQHKKVTLINLHFFIFFVWVKEVEDSSSISSQEDSDEPFELKVEEYSTSLQLVYHLLLRNTEVVDPDMRYNMFENLS